MNEIVRNLFGIFRNFILLSAMGNKVLNLVLMKLILKLNFKNIHQNI